VYCESVALWKETHADFSPTDESTFVDRACMQPGCNKRCDVLFRVKEEHRREDGSRYEGSATRHTGAHRVFCDYHSGRGTQASEDNDKNYEIVWKRPEAV